MNLDKTLRNIEEEGFSLTIEGPTPSKTAWTIELSKQFTSLNFISISASGSTLRHAFISIFQQARDIVDLEYGHYIEPLAPPLEPGPPVDDDIPF